MPVDEGVAGSWEDDGDRRIEDQLTRRNELLIAGEVRYRFGERRQYKWVVAWKGPIRVDTKDIDLAVDGDLAFLSAFNRMQGTKIDGEEVDLWFRTTMCLQRTSKGWFIVHDHTSVPFYMDGSFRAAVDLTPDTAVAPNATAAIALD